MHNVTVRQEIIDRVLARRGRHHLFEALDPRRTALLVIDMQNMFCEPGAPAEVAASRGLCDNITRLCAEMRDLGGLVVWVTSATSFANGRSDWETFLQNFVTEDVRRGRQEYLSPGGHGEQIWRELIPQEGDLHIRKNRYSAKRAFQPRYTKRTNRRHQNQYLLRKHRSGCHAVRPSGCHGRRLLCSII